MSPVLIVAGKELRDGLRDRWLLAITLVFVLFATGIADEIDTRQLTLTAGVSYRFSTY